MDSDDPRRIYWKKNKFITIIVIGIILSCFLVMTFSMFLKPFSLFGIPLDFLFAGQIVILLMIALAFWVVIKQEKLDRVHKMNEDI